MMYDACKKILRCSCLIKLPPEFGYDFIDVLDANSPYSSLFNYSKQSNWPAKLQNRLNNMNKGTVTWTTEPLKYYSIKKIFHVPNIINLAGLLRCLPAQTDDRYCSCCGNKTTAATGVPTQSKKRLRAHVIPLEY